MTAEGLPTEHALSAWYRRFPARRHLWAGRLRLWRVELPVRPPTPPSLLTDWVTKATAEGVPPSAAARRLGLPAAVVAAARSAGTRPDRRTFAFLDLPAGPVPVAVPSIAFDPWPDTIESVPPAVLRPPGAEVVPQTGDWRTVPVVGAEAVEVVAVGLPDRIEAYATDESNEKALWELPPDALPAAGPEAWAAAWRAWVTEQGHPQTAAGTVTVRDGVARVSGFNGQVPEGLWLWAGDGPLREAAPVEVHSTN
jgi:hypothetical protein